MSPTSVQVAASGACWVGRSARSVSQILIEAISGARREILILAYSMTPGAGTLLREVQARGRVGVRVRILVNRFSEQSRTSRTFLMGLVKGFPDGRVYSFEPTTSEEDLHAKVIVIDRSVAIVGSANFSWSGLARNHELCLEVRGETAEVIGKLIDDLILEGPVREIGQGR